MSLRSIVIISTAIFALHGCSGKKAGLDSIERLTNTEIPAEFTKERAVLLIDEERMEISGGSAIHEQRIVKKILKQGHPEEGVFHFRTNKYRKILSIEGRASYPDGRERALSSDDIIVLPAFKDFVLYSDQKSHSFRFPGAVAGTVIEVYIKRKINNLVYWEPALFQRDIPILTRRYTLIHPDGLDFEIHALHMPDTPDSRMALGGGKEKIVWERRNIEPFRRENMMSSWMERVPALWFSARGGLELGAALKLDSWSDIVAWYREITRESLEPDAGLRSMVETLCAPGMPKREAAARIFRWVQANLRYVAVYLGDDGFKPHETEEILTNRYGDCKDKSVVLASALREAGIEASLVLVRTIDLGRVPVDSPSPSHFNHLIVTAAVDGETVYLDPTCETCSFGILPGGNQGAEALVITDGETGLITLPCIMPRPNRLDVLVEVAVASDGDGSMTAKMEFDGHYAAAVRRRLTHRKGKSRSDVVAALFGYDLPAALIEDVTIEGEDPEFDILTIEVKGTIPEMIDTDKSISFVQVVLNPLDTELPDCDHRTHPIALGVPGSSGYDITIELPEGWHVHDGPPPGDIRNEYFEYRYTWNAGGREIRFSRRWSNKTRCARKADCAEVRNQLIAVAGIEKIRIPVERR